MKINLRYIYLLKVSLVFVLFFSIFPEVVFSQKDIYGKVEIEFASSQRTNSCDEHNCPVLPDKPFHHCAVCCAISHFFINQLSSVNFHFDNTPQVFFMDKDILYKELFAKTLFRPPQSTL
ncbi:hypothetical protein [Candidatus Scalindua japonica]|uniref:hypothetical protein n=1 Tax=Candidatus Scalindua japonica TaxID=1284222 RepID=UPI000BDEA27B|nr:hypothetical protein [Candidatus Scalindua japonica]